MLSLCPPLAGVSALGGVGCAEGMGLPSWFGIQLVAAAATALWSAGATYVLTKATGAGARVSIEEEYEGLDLSAHGERTYDHYVTRAATDGMASVLDIFM